MAKQISFGEKDNKLIKRIEEYQKENDIKYFIEAVRQLCQCGLDGNVNVKINLRNK